MGFIGKSKYLMAAIIAVGFAALVSNANTVSTNAVVTANAGSNFGTIKGVVRDHVGNPIADATVAIFKLGTSKLLKQVNSAADGSFVARILPGRYSVLAVAQGFNPVTLNDVAVNKSALLNYGFRLERAGSGNTLPEKRADRNSSKWHVRAAQMQRSIYQNAEGKEPVAESQVDVAETEDEGRSGGGKVRTVVETGVTADANGAFPTLNFATAMPVGNEAEVVIIGQTSIAVNAPQRFETKLTFRPADDHKIRINTAISKLGVRHSSLLDRRLGQLSFQATDEWRVREGLVLVYGVDYSKFFGAGNDSSITPRLGLSFDINEKTRLTTAYTTKTETPTWSQAIDLEGASVLFREPVFIEDLVVSNSKPQMNKSRRFEFAIERVLDGRSSVEAGAFFDTTLGRGVGINALPFDVLGTSEFGELVGNQQGSAQGLRVVYNRRISGTINASAGYSYGVGQSLSGEGYSDPTKLFERSVFQTVFGKIGVDLDTGTSVQTVFRLSPKATVFAIDPFSGRLAIYDPGLSVLVTQRLPTFGMPFRAQATVDARNILDTHIFATGDEGVLRSTAAGRAFRGSILVRF
ncbi:MAG TPA: carboxypeptidase regulatory-like domain-containing protein [Pyrinomonadaceae bacterium]|nr:carboxypeptidase regulatory-like domain-containing protein [Pyrinomonadaceae bacterium]